MRTEALFVRRAAALAALLLAGTASAAHAQWSDGGYGSSGDGDY